MHEHVQESLLQQLLGDRGTAHEPAQERIDRAGGCGVDGLERCGFARAGGGYQVVRQ